MSGQLNQANVVGGLWCEGDAGLVLVDHQRVSGHVLQGLFVAP